MTVSAVIKLEQISPDDHTGGIRDATIAKSNYGVIRDLTAAFAGRTIFTSLPSVSNPTPTSARNGWTTEDEQDWSDSPTFQPFLLYRYRFGWGRDKYERPILPLGSDGARWGNLDNNSGLLLLQRNYAIDSNTSARSFISRSYTRQDQFDPSFSGDLNQMRHLPAPSGDTTVEEFPFVIIAIPEPFSKKNPTDSDIFIRLANFVAPIDQTTIHLFVNDIERDITITEFFGGSGGFDIEWDNDDPFDYGSTVRVRVEFSDTDIPPNDILIRYEFYIVFDLRKPLITNLSPANGAVDIAVDATVSFTVLDNEQNVDITTLFLYVNNRLITEDDGLLQIDQLPEENGYLVQFTPNDPWRYGDLIPVAIFVKDVSGNEAFLSYGFTTIESNVPRLIRFDPQPCENDVLVGSDVKFVIVDGGHGLEKESIQVAIDEIPVDIAFVPVIQRDN